MDHIALLRLLRAFQRRTCASASFATHFVPLVRWFSTASLGVRVLLTSHMSSQMLFSQNNIFQNTSDLLFA